MRKLYFCLLLLFLGAGANAQIDLLTWESTGLAGNEPSFASNFNATGLNSSSITRGAGLTAAANANRINATNWGVTANVDDAVAGNDYFEFTITPNGGNQFSVTQFVFNYERSGTGPTSLTVRSSIDGYTTNIGSITGLAAAITTGNIINISGISGQASAVTFRIYGFGATGTAGSGGFENAAGADFIVRGTAGVGNSVSVAPGTNAAEPATSGTFNVTLSSPAPAGDVTVNYTLGGGVGEAGLGVDYTDPQSGSITIAQGNTSGVITLDVNDDLAFEATEIITITLNSVTNGFSIGTASTTINLLDNDAAPTVSVTAGANAAEPATNGTFTISFSTATTTSTDINYAYTGIAGFGTDYTVSYSAGTPSTAVSTGVLSAPAGVSSITVTITPVNDPDVEGPETITLTLSAPTGGYVIGTGAATINITSEDLPPLAPISLTGATYTQDFNSLAISGTTNLLPIQGWLLNETGGGARDNEQYAADNGGSNTGDTYSYGDAASTERALGSLQSGTLISTFGAFFINNTGNTVSRLKITYTGEQWRLGTINRTDQLNFQYSLNATSLTTGTWIDMNSLDFISPFTTATGALNGNANSKLLSYTITGLSIPDGAIFYIRWTDFNASGADDGLAVDDFSIETDPLDVTGPAITTLSPLNGAVNVETTLNAIISFNEDIQKGTGNIYVKRVADNVTVQTIDVSTAAVTLTGINQASFEISGLFFNTAYYIEADAGTFTDVLNNAFAGISGNAVWSFTTVPPPPAGIVDHTYNFDICTTPLNNGFTQFSVVGPQKWDCTTFGIDAAHSPAGSAPNGVQINGFSGTNIPNEDWLISPSFDLTGTTFPLLSFWSRTAFNGVPLRLKVSTDYPGTGNPNNYTWTDLNGRFPSQTSNVWTLSENINLSAYKSANTYFAFVYFSSDDDGARWTLDDIRVDNSATPPPPSLTVSTTDMQFTYVPGGSTADKTFTFTGNDLTADVTLNSTGDFQLSKDGSSFSPALLYTVAEANNIAKTVYVRFAPTLNGQDFTGTISVATGSLSATINLKGTSIDPATTLEIVNWNIEWLGSTANGPTNEAQQEQNVQTIMQNIGADLFALIEIVDEARLASIVSQLPGYSYVISNYGSHTNTTINPPGALAQAQKLAFVYKTGLFSNITTTPLLSQGINSSADVTNPAYNYWASGRFPYMMTADVTLNCVTKQVRFILVHAKANTAPTAQSYDRRKKGADSLYFTLNNLYPSDNIIILGDFNDDLDESITDGFTITSWNAFTDDAVNYSALTLPLSLAGKKSTVEFNDVIDHVVASNDMQQYYMTSTANILNDVTSLVNNYGSTTSDHFPVFTRYRFEQPAAPVINCPANIEQPNDVGACGAMVNYSVTHSGGCGEANLQQTAGLPGGAVFPVGTTTNTFVVTDAAGGMATCSFTVTITDTQKPVITCPVDITTNTDAGTCGATVNYTVTFTDNCTGATLEQTAGLASGAVFPAGTTTNTFVVTDASGNTETCTFTITVTDNEPPTFTGPADKTIFFTTGCTYDAGIAVTGDVTDENDNCSSGIQAVYTDEVTTCGNIITITRTWTLSDNNGNEAPAQVQIITVTDNNTTYIVYAEKEAKFGEFNLINGSVGVTAANGLARFRTGTVLPSPYFVRAKNINVGFFSFVPNRIFSAADDGPNPPFFNFTGNTSGLPNHTISASTAVPVSANYKDLKIKKNVMVTITGTLYGKIEIEEGAQVTFTPVGGIVNIENLKITGRSNNITRVKFGDCTSVRIKNKVEIGEYTQVNVDGPKVTFCLGDTNSDDEIFEVQGNSNIIAVNIYIKKGSLKVSGDIALMKGWFIAEKVTNEGRLVIWNDNNCTETSAMRELTDAEEKLKLPAAKENTAFTVKVSPNPSPDLFTLQIQSDDNTPVTVRISDVSGRFIMMRQGISSNSRIQMGTELKNGLYFAEVIQGKEKKVVKLVKL